MKISDVSVPQVYKEESWDFRFFLRWFEDALSKVQYDTENIPDLYDPLRCPDWLLWMLGDTMGFKYDDRLTTAFNRLVLVYFMSMIRNKGSKDGVTLAAEVNLAQFNIWNYGRENPILDNRLEDVSIPANSVVVTPHVEEGYIDVTYFSEQLPIDACIEYVRPLGMYCFQHAGVRADSRTKISIDAELTQSPNNLGMSIGPTHVGHYSRDDYARMQRIQGEEFEYWARQLPDDKPTVKRTNYLTAYSNITKDADEKYNQYAPITSDNRSFAYNYSNDGSSVLSKRQRWQKAYVETRRDTKIPLIEATAHEFSDTYYLDDRQPVYYRNSMYETEPTENISSEYINPGYRAMYSLQLCNNEHIVSSLLPNVNKIFGLGYRPTDAVPGVDVSIEISNKPVFKDPIHSPLYDVDEMPVTYNLRYDESKDSYFLLGSTANKVRDISVIDPARSAGGITSPRPAVNPIMTTVGDAISINSKNSQYVLRVDDSGNYPPNDYPDSDSDKLPSGEQKIGNIHNLSVYNIVSDGRRSTKVTDKDDIETDSD